MRTAGGPRGDDPGCTQGDASAAWGAAAQGQPWGRGCAAQQGYGNGGTPLPPLFFSHQGRHTLLPAQAAPVLPAPIAIIRRAAGSQGCISLPWGSWHPWRGSPGQWGCASHLSACHAARQGAGRWCWGGILCSTPYPGSCHHRAISACVEGELLQAAAGSRDEPAQAEPAHGELEKSPAGSLLSAFHLQRGRQLSLINLPPPGQAGRRFYLHRAGGRSRV